MNVNDNINIEYEARVMINEEQYLNIRSHYLTNKYQYVESINENYYFDTEDLKLSNSHKVLRVRKINEKKYELTLKIQEENGCLEISQPLTSLKVKELKEKGTIPSDKIKEQLILKGINPEAIRYITNLKTERVEVKLEDCLLVIDKNYFQGRVDYNLEVESDSEIHAKNQLIAIISPFGIKYKKDYINKARRAIYNL